MPPDEEEEEHDFDISFDDDDFFMHIYHKEIESSWLHLEQHE